MPPLTLITSAPPNPNGDLHLGHLSGPFLGADVLRRQLAVLGHPVLHLGYTDDESCYVPRRAAELGRTARQTSFLFTNRIVQTLELAGMAPDYYEHPHREPVHRAVVQEHFARLYDSGALVERDLPVPVCPVSGKFLYESDLRGRCQRCGMPTDGTYCEDCGHAHDPGGLDAPVCVQHQVAPTDRLVRRLVLPLQKYAGPLAEYYAERTWRPALLDYCQRLLADGLPEMPVTRRTDYGIPVPLPGWDGDIVDTWTSGIFGYMAATAAYTGALGDPEGWRDLWSDPDTRIINFLGFDCGFSHAVLWPAMLLALGDRTLPEHVITNEFATLEGAKFSTSRGHAIWGAPFLREHHPDALRLHLCLTNPEQEQSDFTRAEFDRTVRDVLAGTVEDWAADVFTDPVPGPPPGALLERLVTEVGGGLEPATFSLRRASGGLVGVVTEARDALRAGADRAGHAALLAAVAQASAAIMPAWSRHVWEQLGLPGPADPEGTLGWPGFGSVPEPAPVGPYRRLFRVG
jgi:methionyl-tRNA synthetase